MEVVKFSQQNFIASDIMHVLSSAKMTIKAGERRQDEGKFVSVGEYQASSEVVG